MNRTILPMKRVIGPLSLQSIGFIFFCPFKATTTGKMYINQPDDCSWHPDQTVIVSREEQKKKWHDLSEDRMKQIKVQISRSS